MQGLLLSRSLPSIRRSFASHNTRCLATKPPPSNQSRRPAKVDVKPPSTPEPPKPSSSKNAPEVPAGVKAENAPPSPTSLSLDFSPVVEPDEPAQRTGAKSSKDSLSSIERKRRFLGRATLAAMGLGIFSGVVYLGRDWEEEEVKERTYRKQDMPATRFGRTKERFTGLFDYFNKPSWEDLLPPPVPPFQKPYTLLISIDDLIVASTWDRVNGWRTAKRPGVDYFLGYLSQFYEIVIFTTQHHYTALPIIEKLDPYNFFITYKLFRESTRSVNGTATKDLSYLNRDLSKVVILDAHPEHVSLQPENAIIMPPWKGDSSDKGLIAMIPFLESIAIYKPADVRPILTAYHGKNIPLEYAKKEAEAKKQFLEEWRKSGKAAAPGGGFTLSSLFGGSSEPSGPEPLTYLEQKRKEAQAHYLEEQHYIETNKAHFDKLIEEERQAAAAQMSGNLFTVMASLAGAPPQSQAQPQQEKSGDVHIPVGGSEKVATTPPAAGANLA